MSHINHKTAIRVARMKCKTKRTTCKLYDIADFMWRNKSDQQLAAQNCLQKKNISNKCFQKVCTAQASCKVITTQPWQRNV